MPQDPLAELRDIHLPSAISAWPPAIGWWIVTAITLCAIFFALWFLYKKHQGNAYRRQAENELQLIHQDWQETQNTSRYLQAANALLRRVSNNAYPQKNTTSLTEQNWIDFLNTSAKKPLFNKEVSKQLTQDIYAKESNANIVNLHKSIEAWIKEHGEPIE